MSESSNKDKCIKQITLFLSVSYILNASISQAVRYSKAFNNTEVILLLPPSLYKLNMLYHMHYLVNVYPQW